MDEQLESTRMIQESNYSPTKFIEWVVWYANTLSSDLTPIRIVKFLYLVDLYNARRNRRTLSCWPWKFIHYGPFCGEAIDAISSAESMGLIEGKPFAGRFDKDTRFYKHAASEEPESYPEGLDVYVASEIKYAVKLWSDDTYGLLNHVYFQTEPMLKAQPYEVLDFSCAEMPIKEEPLPMAKLSNKKVKHARELLRELRGSREKGCMESMKLAAQGLHDDSYFRALELLQDDLIIPSLSGTVLLKS